MDDNEYLPRDSVSQFDESSYTKSTQYPKKTLLLIVFLACVAVTMFVFSMYFLFKPNSNVSNSENRQEESETKSEENVPTPSPEESPEPLLGDILSIYSEYSIKNDQVYANNKPVEIMKVKRFVDNQVGISFLYPDSLYFNTAIEPVTSYRPAPSLIAALTDDQNHTKSIEYLMDCRSDPNPAGLCGEGVPVWLDISISRVGQPIPDDVRIEEFAEYKGFGAYAANLDGSKTYRYKVYIQPEDIEYAITFSSQQKISEHKEYSFAIWLLINSFEVN